MAYLHDWPYNVAHFVELSMTTQQAVPITALPHLLGRDRKTVRRWANQGRFGPLHTPVGLRSYRYVLLEALETEFGPFSSSQLETALLRHERAKLETTQKVRTRRNLLARPVNQPSEDKGISQGSSSGETR